MQAAEVSLVMGFATKGVQVIAQPDTRAEMTVESFAGVNQFRAIKMQANQFAAMAVAGEQDRIAMNNRITNVRVVAAFERITPEDVASGWIESDQAFGGKNQSDFFAL